MLRNSTITIYGARGVSPLFLWPWLTYTKTDIRGTIRSHRESDSFMKIVKDGPSKTDRKGSRCNNFKGALDHDLLVRESF